MVCSVSLPNMFFFKRKKCFGCGDSFTFSPKNPFVDFGGGASFARIFFFFARILIRHFKVLFWYN